MNKLELSNNDTSLTGSHLLGRVVSCVCHRGPVNGGHYVSYHKVADQWFLNDDSRPCQATEDPFQQTRHALETIELLFFVNDV